jgi:hypothetical protein
MLPRFEFEEIAERATDLYRIYNPTEPKDKQPTIQDLQPHMDAAKYCREKEKAAADQVRERWLKAWK